MTVLKNRWRLGSRLAQLISTRFQPSGLHVRLVRRFSSSKSSTRPVSLEYAKLQQRAPTGGTRISLLELPPRTGRSWIRAVCRPARAAVWNLVIIGLLVVLA